MTQNKDFTIELISVEDCLTFGEHLFKLHWQELAMNKKVMELSPYREKYGALEESGGIFILGVFIDNELVGYSVNLVSPHLHYSKVLFCYNDLIFVSPDYRHLGIGEELIKQTKKEAKSRGCPLLFWHAKEGTSFFKYLSECSKVHEVCFCDEL